MAPVDWTPFFAGLHEHGFARRRDLTIDARICAAREFIDAHAGETIDVQTVARSAALSPYHFIRQFRRAYGRTPHQYLTEQRIQRAQALLRDTDLAITDVCLEVGFSSLGSFSDLFRRVTGHAPSRYRRHFLQALWEPPRIPCCFLQRFAKPQFSRSAPGPGRLG